MADLNASRGREPRGPYKMGTISQLTGLSPVLLRAWERRYDLLRPMRGPGGHRLYTDDDLRVLESAQRLIASGRSIGEVAAVGREALLGERMARDGDDSRRDETASGSSVESLVRQAVESAVNLDSAGIHDALDTAASVLSPTSLIQDVIERAAREIGDLWTAGKCSVAGEHLASGIFVDRLQRLIETAATIDDGFPTRVIAACLPDERHQLGLLILSYFLNRHGISVLSLGADLPFDDLELAVNKSRPAAVLLSVTRRATYRKHRGKLMDIARMFAPETVVYVGGVGVSPSDEEAESAGVRLRPAGESARGAAAALATELRNL